MPGPYRTEESPLAGDAQASSHTPPPAAGSPTPGGPGAVDARGGTAPNRGQDSSGNPSANNQKPKTFSERQYLENMKQDLNLESLRNEDLGKYIK